MGRAGGTCPAVWHRRKQQKLNHHPPPAIWILSSFFPLKKILLLFSYSCPHLSHMALPCPTHPSTSPFNPHPIVFVHGSSIHVPGLDPSPSFPNCLSSPSPLVTVSLFFISMSLFLFCLLVCFVDRIHL